MLDFRYAIRSLRRTPALAGAAVLTLALGIGATTTMFSVVYAALLRPLPFSEPDRIVMLFMTRTTPQDGTVRMRWSVPVTTMTTSAVASYESMATVTGATISINTSDGAAAEQIDSEMVSPAYFSVLRITPAAGRLFLADEDRSAGADPVAIVSDRMWRRRFNADPALVGQTIRINDVPLTVVGIAPAGFAGVTGKADVWIPRTMAPVLTYSEYLTSPQNFISFVARLRPGVTVAQANAELAALSSAVADALQRAGRVPGQQEVWGAVALPIGEARIDETMRRSVILLLAAAGCLLGIACVNVAGMLLARARTRRREIAIRLAIGSNRRRLIGQLLIEGFIIASAAGVLGTTLAAWGVAIFVQTSPGIIATFANGYAAIASFAAPSLDRQALVFAIAITLATTLLCALLPAIDGSRPNLVSALKENDQPPGRRPMLAALVISEVALAVLLLAAAGLLLETFDRMQAVRGGFDTERVLTFWIRPPNSRYSYVDDGPAILERMLTRIERVPGVESAAVDRCTPFMGCSRTTLTVIDKPAPNPPGVSRHYTSADYFKTLRIPLIAGRVLTDGDRPGAAPVTVINETAARRFWPGENPIGKRVRFGNTTGFVAQSVEVVGVVGDVKYDAPGQPMNSEFYTSYRQFAFPDTMMLVKTRGPSLSLVPAIRAAIAEVDSSVPMYAVMTLDDRISDALSRPRFNATIVAAFAIVALLLAALGVYGILSYSVSSRTRELGVRVALGADGLRVIGLVLREGMKLTLIGAAAGVVAALVLGRLLKGLLVGVAPTDPRVLAVGVAVMLTAAAIAAWLPARRASAVDPIEALRDR